MTSKKVNWIFLSILGCHFLIMFWLIIAMFRGMEFGAAESFFWGEMSVAIPFLLYYVMRDGTLPVKEELGFHKIRISTAFLSILYTILVMPLITLTNVISMLFVDNTIGAMEEEILMEPFLVMLLLVGIAGPICEEMMFRGIIFRTYRREGSLVGAALLSALLFAVMHLNFNQAGYALVVGIAFAFLMVATGSIWAPIIGHCLINSQNILLMYLPNTIFPDAISAEEEVLSRDMLLVVIGVYAILAAVMTTLAVCLLVWMAKREGRAEELKRLWEKPTDGKRRITIPLMIALVIAFLYMLIEAVAAAFM